jgi:hypothetical protein
MLTFERIRPPTVWTSALSLRAADVSPRRRFLRPRRDLPPERPARDLAA